MEAGRKDGCREGMGGVGRGGIGWWRRDSGRVGGGEVVRVW